MPSDRLLLASIHDVSPRFESEVDALVDLLGAHVGTQLAMLVVPNHWGEAPIVAGSRFAGRLRAWAESGIEMFLHGYTHRDDSPAAGGADRLRARFMTAGEGEFLGLGLQEATRRIADGRSLLEDVIGGPIRGFIAPAWLYGPGANEALERCGIAIAEDHMRVWSPRSAVNLAWGPVITWASRTGPRLASSLVSAAVLRRLPLRALRIAVHPPDLRHPVLVGSIERTLSVAAGSRRPARYSDLLAGYRCRDFQ